MQTKVEQCTCLFHSWNKALVLKILGFVQLLFQSSTVWNTSACHLIFWNNLLSFSNWYLLICIFLCYQWFRMKKTWELDSAISASEPRKKKTLCQGFKDNCTIRNKTLLHGALTALLKLLFYSPKIKWAFLSVCLPLSFSRSLIPFSALALWLISEASWECWIMYAPPYRRGHNAILERLGPMCLLDNKTAALCAVLFKTKH